MALQIVTTRLFLAAFLLLPFLSGAADSGAPRTVSAWPEKYSVAEDARAGRLTLSTPYYTVEHDLKRGGAIAAIRLVHGRASNQLTRPLATRIRNEEGMSFSDLTDPKARVSRRSEGGVEIVTVDGRLLDANGHVAEVGLKTVLEYHWGYIRIHKELTIPSGSFRAREVCPFETELTPNFTDYGYREGTTEQEGAPRFNFGSNRWGKLRAGVASDASVETRYMPRSVLLADPGVEGVEWFAGSDLSQWDLQLTGKRGQGRFSLRRTESGLAISIAPFLSADASAPLPKSLAFDFYIGIPLIEGHALRPWLHTSFNRNRGDWASAAQVARWAESGIQTVHCHNDGDYYDDGLFWRDGSYPPYPDMDKYDKVIEDCQRAGIRVATYFSNKELHPSTREFQEHGREWGRMDRAGNLQHNVYRGTNEFGAQMCLRSGWLDFLKFSIDRVLKNHPLNGVYYDWNVGLLCWNPLHEGKNAGEAASGHWDIEELLNLMEWTRQRVGPNGLVIVHNTTTPMFTMENFADDVVANEWGYGAWKEDGPALDQLPLEWSLVNARSRGVISYGQLNAQSPERLHRLFALEALLSGVTPWPASPETFKIFSALKPLGDVERWRFADWRNQAVTLDNPRCASAVYSRPGEAGVLVGNLSPTAQKVRCAVRLEKLPSPLASVSAAKLTGGATGTETLDVGELAGTGARFVVPADGILLLQIQK